MHRAAVVLFLLACLLTPAPATADPPLVVFIHGRYQDASTTKWADDSPALDATVKTIEEDGPLGKRKAAVVSVPGQGTRYYIRDNYWRRSPNGLADAVEGLVGRANVLYVRYDAKNSYVYEPHSAPFVADQVRPWLAAHAGRKVIFICHSHGGIVARYLLSHPEHYADIIARTREVIALGSPQTGSELADAALDGKRTQNLTDGIASLDSTMTGAGKLFTKDWSLFTVINPQLRAAVEPVRQQAEKDADAQHLKGHPHVKYVRIAESAWLARTLDSDLSGRIDDELSSATMAQLTALPPTDPHSLLPAERLPVPLYWVGGERYPISVGNVNKFIKEIDAWTPEDWEFFLTSSLVVDARLHKRYPSQHPLQRNDGVVSMGSAMFGKPLTGDPATSTVPTHHDGLLYEPAAVSRVVAHLSSLH